MPHTVVLYGAMKSSLCVVVLAALALTGCGGGERLTKGEYLERGREIQVSTSLLDAGRLFFRLSSGRVSAEECQDGTVRFRDAAASVVAEVDEIRPPQEIEQIHDRLVAAAQESIDALDGLVDDVSAGEVSCGQEWNRRAYGLASTERAQAVLKELEQQGYDFIGE